MHEMKMAAHESLQIMELLNAKNLAYTKSVAMYKLITCPELKSLVMNEIKLSEEHIRELRGKVEEKNQIN